MGIWDKFYERAQSFFKESGAAGGSTEPKSRCYYDLLEVSREATDDEIKRSFKRLALQWHPDKNPDRAEECTAYFVLIQQAYEVLLDPQERAFYDRHRENIIYQQQQTTDSTGGVERRDTGINLEPYMSTSCFRQGGGSGVAAGFVGGLFSAAMPFATSPRNVDIELSEEEQEQFFTVYRDLFHKLAAEEYAYIEEPEERNFPVFGKATSDYDTVVAPFYGFWLDFTTQRSFAWLDKWDLRQAPDRPTARAMEKENRKSREQGRKQRSEQVRKVVEFVRRYDVRVQRAKELQRERNARIHQIVEEQRLQTIRRNLENMPTFERDEEAHRQHLAHLEEIEQALDAEFGTVGSAADDDEATADGGGNGTSAGDENSANVGRSGGGGTANKFRCIVCEKNFNTKNVLVSHQRSKKHRQMVELLRAHMRTEDQQLFFAGGEGAAAAEESGGTKNDGGGRETDEDEESDSSDHNHHDQQGPRRGKKKRQRKQQRREAAAARRLEEEEREQQRQDGEEQAQREEETGDGDERARCVAAEEKENNNSGNNSCGGREGECYEIAVATEEAESGNITVKKEAETAKKRKKGKRTDEQQRKTAAAAGGHEEQQSKGPVHCECTRCGAEFESKTKLHAHLRDSGHATLKTVADKIGAAAADSATDSGGRRRRKKK